jgi:putative ABC transport system permease protein
VVSVSEPTLLDLTSQIVSYWSGTLAGMSTSPTTTADLTHVIEQGGRAKFLFFWGHRPQPDGSLGAGCLSQWWPAAASYNDLGQEGGPTGHPVVELGIPRAGGQFTSHPLYVATPEVLRLYELDSLGAAPDTDVLSVLTGQPELVNIPERGVHPKTQMLPNLGYSSTPNSLITASALARHGWQRARVGWFLQASQPLTQQQLATAQDVAASAGLTIESRREQASLETLRTGATVAGILLALGVLATTVGPIRGEGANDLRTLTATGAPKRVRRTLTATTAGALALLGAILGLAGAYIALVSALHRNLGALTGVPISHLAAITAGLPLLSVAAGWLLAGRQPQAFARRGLD